MGSGCSGPPPPSLPVANCSITWAVYTEGNYNLLLLVEIEDTAARKYFQLVRYDLGNWWGAWVHSRQGGGDVARVPPR